MSSLLEALKTRRSVKQEFIDRPIEDDVIFQVLESATWAPSAHNSQPWNFVVINDKATKRRLAENMALAWRKDFEREPMPIAEREMRTARSIDRISNAPTVLVACLNTERLKQYVDERKRGCEYTMAIQSVAAAIQNLLLAAHELNLGSCWMCAPLFCQKTVRETLDIPSDVEPQALILLGYFRGSIQVPSRKPITEIVHIDHW